MGGGGGEGQEQKEEEGSREWLKQSLYNTGELISFALQDDSGLLSILYTAIDCNTKVDSCKDFSTDETTLKYLWWTVR